MSAVVEMTFEFLSELVGQELLAAEVDNMSRTVRFRYRDEFDHHDIAGVSPSVRQRFYELGNAFVIEKQPGKADRLVLNRLHPIVAGVRKPTDQEVIAGLKAELHAARQAMFAYALK